ncbi:MFS transporter [Telluria beijingensis]|uniref:MFS transporter n=1 Tax=Telluria beijingensis TaxID=3068633 RepID=UPI0027960540|nr:MFS transporter [Massilia sp. REN29]
MPAHIQAAHKRPTSPWLILGFFTLAYALAYLDRQVLTLLIEPIRHSVGLSDTQLGLLQGGAFAICFALGGVPLGWLVDNGNRVRVASGCIAVWSIATGFTGLGTTYAQLLAARSATAVAEAGCSPAAISVFADVFAPRQLPRATAIYMSAPYIGGGAALFLGGLALHGFEQSGGLVLPLAGHLEPWQAVFVVLALPGLLLALLMLLLLREPPRLGSGAASVRQTSLRETVRFIARESGHLPGYFLAYACILAALFSLLTWYPALAVRAGYGEAAAVGRPLGLAFMVCGIAGTLGAQWIVGKVADQDVLPRVLRIARWMTLAVGALALAQWSTASFMPSLACYALAILATSVLTSIMPIPLQVGVPNRMRGRVTGLFLLSVNLVGVTLGTALIGAISDAFGGSAAALAAAMAGVIVACSAAAFLFLRRAARRLPPPATIPPLTTKASNEAS